jgi:hypothetical protein
MESTTPQEDAIYLQHEADEQMGSASEFSGMRGPGIHCSSLGQDIASAIDNTKPVLHSCQLGIIMTEKKNLYCFIFNVERELVLHCR